MVGNKLISGISGIVLHVACKVLSIVYWGISLLLRSYSSILVAFPNDCRFRGEEDTGLTLPFFFALVRGPRFFGETGEAIFWSTSAECINICTLVQTLSTYERDRCEMESEETP